MCVHIFGAIINGDVLHCQCFVGRYRTTFGPLLRSMCPNAPSHTLCLVDLIGSQGPVSYRPVRDSSEGLHRRGPFSRRLTGTASVHDLHPCPVQGFRGSPTRDFLGSRSRRFYRTRPRGKTDGGETPGPPRSPPGSSYRGLFPPCLRGVDGSWWDLFRHRCRGTGEQWGRSLPSHLRTLSSMVAFAWT